jgi:transposase
VIEVEVKAPIRRIARSAYTRNPGCTCGSTPAILTAAPPPRLIPRSPYAVSVWVEVILSKFRYGQPSNRYLQDLGDQGLPVSPGTLADGLQAVAPLFEPVLEALYCKQMSEALFHNDETRWEVFVEIEDKVGTRWYLWVTRSASVVFYCIDPSRSAAVPRCPAPILPAYGRTAKSLSSAIATAPTKSSPDQRKHPARILLGSWAPRRPGRRTRLCRARGGALQWKERIGTLYHLNRGQQLG